MVPLSHLYMTTGKAIALNIQTFLRKVMSLLFNTLIFHSFSSKEQMSFNFLAVDTIRRGFGAQENKICHCFHLFSFCLPWSDGTGCDDLSFLELSFQQAFKLSSFSLTERLFSSLLSAIRVVSCASLRLLVFLSRNLDSSLCFIQPGISHDVLCIQAK